MAALVPRWSRLAATVCSAVMLVSCRHGGETSRLTAREFALLQALLTRPGAILSRSDLERQIYGWNEEVESNAIEFLIHAIRRKIGPSAIRNVRGVGWMVDRPT